ncbi:hypothetical protein [Novosphingobium sp. Fuku2-ISO-50]|uniref:hypothetical protein n=1 Tax=Novosphingobium sp. Fuku2-ISO-50 TaxID=1739114 RepID=UPI00076BEF65|nr:hypothetical protein [Novosphingobium sp. Fuku2-ISO-50]KUR76702.1 hypothetical protein AQZ50_12555 [Novosphingobium sp. Fuku2-ISO-50]
MIEAVLVVLTKARPGREADLDDWYTNIHIRDALRFRGSITAQRFARSADQPTTLPPAFDWQYLALYDVFDAARFSREHWDNALTTRMMVTDAIDDSVLEDYHYYPLAFRDNDPDVPHTGGVILEQLNAAPGQDARFRDWYIDEYLPQAMRRPGVHSASLGVFRSHGQMIPTTPGHNYVGIYKVNDKAAWQAWQDGVQSPFIDEPGMRVTHWDWLTARLTKDAVQNPTSEGLAAEEQARLRMGDRVLTAGADKLGAA